MITPRYTGRQVAGHVAWTKVKASAMRRPHLDCGCRNDGVETYLHLGCARIACKAHADDPHECQHYEPEPPPREPVVSKLDTRGEVDPVTEVLRNTAYPRANELPPVHPNQPSTCCDLHGSNCEQGGEECCDDCTERLHFADNHGGLECSAPVREVSAEEFSRGEWLRQNPDAALPVTFAVDVSRLGEAAVAIRGASGHMWILDEVQQFGGERFERVAAESDAPPIDAALNPALDHSSHSMQWVGACPECPAVDAAAEGPEVPDDVEAFAKERFEISPFTSFRAGERTWESISEAEREPWREAAARFLAHRAAQRTAPPAEPWWRRIWRRA